MSIYRNRRTERDELEDEYVPSHSINIFEELDNRWRPRWNSADVFDYRVRVNPPVRIRSPPPVFIDEGGPMEIDYEENPQNDDCIICMQPLSMPIVRLRCGHTFHEKCFAEWSGRNLQGFIKHRTCPICRDPGDRVPTSTVQQRKRKPSRCNKSRNITKLRRMNKSPRLKSGKKAKNKTKTALRIK